MNAAPTIEVLLEGQPRVLPQGTTLAGLVASLGHAPAEIVTAVNASFVPREERDTRVLEAGDSVLLFKPIVGG